MSLLSRRVQGGARFRRSQRGTSAVEFALVLPIFLFVLFGFIELSVAFYDKAVLANASREGARAGVVLRNPKLSTAEIQQVVQNYTNGALLTFGVSSPPEVTVTQFVPLAGDPTPSHLSVTVSYTYAGLGLGAMLSAINYPVVMSATSVMIHE